MAKGYKPKLKKEDGSFEELPLIATFDSTGKNISTTYATKTTTEDLQSQINALKSSIITPIVNKVTNGGGLKLDSGTLSFTPSTTVSGTDTNAITSKAVSEAIGKIVMPTVPVKSVTNGNGLNLSTAGALSLSPKTTVIASDTNVVTGGAIKNAIDTSIASVQDSLNSFGNALNTVTEELDKTNSNVTNATTKICSVETSVNDLNSITEKTANKATTISTDTINNTKYPTTSAVNAFITSKIPTNYVTTNTTQTISGAKTFTGAVNATSINVTTITAPSTVNISAPAISLKLGTNTITVPNKTGTLVTTDQIIVKSVSNANGLNLNTAGALSFSSPAQLITSVTNGNGLSLSTGKTLSFAPKTSISVATGTSAVSEGAVYNAIQANKTTQLITSVTNANGLSLASGRLSFSTASEIPWNYETYESLPLTSAVRVDAVYRHLCRCTILLRWRSILSDWESEYGLNIPNVDMEAFTTLVIPTEWVRSYETNTELNRALALATGRYPYIIEQGTSNERDIIFENVSFSNIASYPENGKYVVNLTPLILPSNQLYNTALSFKIQLLVKDSSNNIRIDTLFLDEEGSLGLPEFEVGATDMIGYGVGEI